MQQKANLGVKKGSLLTVNNKVHLSSDLQQQLSSDHMFNVSKKSSHIYAGRLWDDNACEFHFLK